jgi:hypothetical protein
MMGFCENDNELLALVKMGISCSAVQLTGFQEMSFTLDSVSQLFKMLLT